MNREELLGDPRVVLTTVDDFTSGKVPDQGFLLTQLTGYAPYLWDDRWYYPDEDALVTASSAAPDAPESSNG